MKEGNKSAKHVLPKEETESYWKELWSTEITYNDKVQWLKNPGMRTASMFGKTKTQSMNQHLPRLPTKYRMDRFQVWIKL